MLSQKHKLSLVNTFSVLAIRWGCR